METRLQFDILPQPNTSTCGPTCLHAVYRYYSDDIPLARVIQEVPSLSAGGTLEVMLACHALRRGYRAHIYAYNLKLFDPTWFRLKRVHLQEKLRAQATYKDDPKLQVATRAYLEFLQAGGQLHFADLTPGLIRKYLRRGAPILTGLSSTYLYHSPREYGPNDDDDDVRGEPAGHFVVLCGYDRNNRSVLIADPMHPNPLAPEPLYPIRIERVLCAILLGIVSYDANLLIIEPHTAQQHAKELP